MGTCTHIYLLSQIVVREGGWTKARVSTGDPGQVLGVLIRGRAAGIDERPVAGSEQVHDSAVIDAVVIVASRGTVAIVVRVPGRMLPRCPRVPVDGPPGPGRLRQTVGGPRWAADQSDEAPAAGG